MATNNTDQQKYLSLEGLKTFWGKIKDYVSIENGKIRVSVGKNGELVDVSVDKETGRVLTINEAALKTRLTTIDDTVAGLDTRLDTAESDIDALQTTVTKLDGEASVEGSVKQQVATALASAKDYTDALETKLRDGHNTDTLQTLRTAIDSMSGDSGSVATAINKAINALDVTDTATPGEYVSSVSETDGIVKVTRAKLPTYSVTDSSDFVSVASVEKNGDTVFTISTSNIAKADELADLTTAVRALDDAENGKVPALEKKVAALASATHFIGVKTELPATAANGDICIVGNKEYIYSKPKGSETGEWKELGDTTAEQARIGALETTVGTAAQGEKPATGLVGKVEALEKAVGGSTVVNTFGDQSGNISVDTTATGAGNVKFAMVDKKLTATVDIGATAIQGAKADTAVQGGKVMPDGKHTNVTFVKDTANLLNIKVDVNTVDATGYTDTTSTAIPTAGSVMSKIEAAITALTAKQTTGTDITKIVTGVTQENGKIDVTSVAFNAITDAEINALS